MQQKHEMMQPVGKAKEKSTSGKKWAEIKDDTWSVKYKKRVVMIERDAFRGKDFYKISIDTEKYQWMNNRRIETLEAAKLYVFEIIDWEETQ